MRRALFDAPRPCEPASLAGLATDALAGLSALAFVMGAVLLAGGFSG
ncbi:hypothetical protein [Chelativorans sp.]|nr:hypothetical protein [Chelativorans sp.]